MTRDYRELRELASVTHDRFSELNYDTSLSLNQKMNLLVQHFKNIVIDWDEMIKYLDDFKEKFDEKLYDTLEDILLEWLESGKFTDIIAQLIVMIGDLDSFRDWDKTVIEKMRNEFQDRGLNIRWFGAVDDGLTDCTEQIQAAIDYAYTNGIWKVLVPASPAGFYHSKPLILKTKVNSDNEWWLGQGIKLIGEDIYASKLIKNTEDVWTGIHPNIDGKNSSVILHTQDRSGEQNPTSQQSTGIMIENITLNNKSCTCEDPEEIMNSTVVTGQACERLQMRNVNLINKWGKGIDFGVCYSSLFENIRIDCKSNAFKIVSGTSNKIRFVYTSSCKDPYILSMAYSFIESLCCDACTGTIFTIDGRGTIWNIATESPLADIIVQGGLLGTEIQSLTIHRQRGNELNDIENVYVLKPRLFINVGVLSILETADLTSLPTGYIADVSTTNPDGAVTVGQIGYIKQGYTNPPLKFSKVKSGSPLVSGKVGKQGQELNLRRNYYMPFVGSRNLSETFSNVIDKAIYFDSNTPNTLSDGTSITQEQGYNVGDILLQNDPKTYNRAGHIVTEKNGSFVGNNAFAPIPINLTGTTAQRPTANLYRGLMFYDYTLGKPIWVHEAVSQIWHDASGAVV